MSSLFDAPEDDGPGAPDSGAPLAVRMRPRALDEVVGQQHLLGPRAPLRRLVDEIMIVDDWALLQSASSQVDWPSAVSDVQATLRHLRALYGTWACLAEVMGVSAGSIQQLASGNGGSCRVASATCTGSAVVATRRATPAWISGEAMRW